MSAFVYMLAGLTFNDSWEIIGEGDDGKAIRVRRSFEKGRIIISASLADYLPKKCNKLYIRCWLDFLSSAEFIENKPLDALQKIWLLLKFHFGYTCPWNPLSMD